MERAESPEVITVGPLSDKVSQQDHISKLIYMGSEIGAINDWHDGQIWHTFFKYKIPETGEEFYSKYEYPKVGSSSWDPENYWDSEEWWWRSNRNEDGSRRYKDILRFKEHLNI